MNLAKFLRTFFLQNTSGRVLWLVENGKCLAHVMVFLPFPSIISHSHFLYSSNYEKAIDTPLFCIVFTY